VTSTDVFTTAVLWVGSKSLSHVLACIERTKDRLLDAGAVSETARAQIISAVMAYWSAHPGVALSIVEKLLNYSILSPAAVIQWAFQSHAGARRGVALAEAHLFELVFNTVVKVTGRVRQVVAAPPPAAPALKEDGDVAMEGSEVAAAAAAAAADEARSAEIQAMRDLFRLIDDSLVAWAAGSKDELLEGQTDDTADQDAMVRRWGERWLRAFRRRAAIEEAFLVEQRKRKEAVATAAAAADVEVNNGVAA